MAVVMVTAIDDAMVAESMFEAGVFDYVAKPIRRDRILRSVANALHRRALEIANRTYRENLEQMVAARTFQLKQALEFGIIKTHPQTGYDILKDITFPWPIAQIVLQHHERMDGSGYPQGLSGENTLLEARVLAVADVVEAMASHRPYRPALGQDKALDEIRQNRGTLYDTVVVDACLELFMKKGFKFE